MPYVPAAPSVPTYAAFDTNPALTASQLTQTGEAATAAQTAIVPGGAAAAEAATAGGVAEVGGTVGVEVAAGAATDLVVPAAVGYGVYRGLRAIPGWDAAWMHVGGALDSAWSHIGGGGSDRGASLIDVHQRINANNVIRNQVNAGRMTQVQAQIGFNSRRIRQVARGVSAVNRGAAHGDTRTLQLSHAYTVSMGSYLGTAIVEGRKLDRTFTVQQANAAQLRAQAWSVSHIYRPLGDHIVTVEHQLGTLQRAVPAIAGAAAAAAVAHGLAPVLRTLTALQQDVSKLKTENDECTEPMCETVGPKSDWGKLLKRFTPSLFFALIAELAALHPDEVEKVAGDLARVLGPILDRWAEDWIGLLPGSTGDEASRASSVVGQIPPPFGGALPMP